MANSTVRATARTTLPRPTRRGQTPKGALMRKWDEEPRGGSHIWLMAVMVICLAPAMDGIAADITIMAIAIWAMRRQ